MLNNFKRALPRCLTILFVAGSVVSCTNQLDDESQLNAGGVSVGQLKGYDAIQAQVVTRLLTGTGVATFSLTRIFSSGSDLASYMGRYEAGGELANATPNSVNMLLWDLTLTRLADSISKLCDDGTAPFRYAQTSFEIKASLREGVVKLCAGSTDGELLDGLWARIMLFDAPDAEREAWKEFVLGSKPIDGATAPWVRASLRAAFMNPFYLLNQ